MTVQNFNRFHGTSEGVLHDLLSNGFVRAPLTGPQKVSVAIAEISPSSHEQLEEMTRQVIKAHSRIFFRAREFDDGKKLYVTNRSDVAGEYAEKFAQHGGEFYADVYDALTKLGVEDAMPRFKDARPVLLKLSVPINTIAYDGAAIQSLQQSKFAIDAYETYVDDASKVHIESVTFAVRNLSGRWSFEGQTELSVDQARSEINQHFIKPASVMVHNSIFDIFDQVKTLPDACVRAVLSGSVISVSVTESDGTRNKILIPDPEFMPDVEKLVRYKLINANPSTYNLPQGLAARDVVGYVYALKTLEQNGAISLDQQQKYLSDLTQKIQQENVSLLGISLGGDDTISRHEMFLNAVAHGLSPKDIQHHISPAAQDVQYQERKLKTLSATGIITEFNFSPETLTQIDTAMQKKYSARACSYNLTNK